MVVWPDGYRTAAPEQANAMDRALRQRVTLLPPCSALRSRFGSQARRKGAPTPTTPKKHPEAPKNAAGSTKNRPWYYATL